jgi:hypothetical protein
VVPELRERRVGQAALEPVEAGEPETSPAPEA